MKPVFRLALALSLLSAISTSCSRANRHSAGADNPSFAQAPAEVKAIWVQASEAARTNAYVTAYNLLYELSSASLSTEQKDAVVQANKALNERLLAAVDKNDPEAAKALDEMRKHPPNRNHSE